MSTNLLSSHPTTHPPLLWNFCLFYYFSKWSDQNLLFNHSPPLRPPTSVPIILDDGLTSRSPPSWTTIKGYATGTNLLWISILYLLGMTPSSTPWESKICRDGDTHSSSRWPTNSVGPSTWTMTLVVTPPLFESPRNNVEPPRLLLDQTSSHFTLHHLNKIIKNEMSSGICLL